MVIGYTTGVYDLFHIGHLNLLKNAKGLCDKLIVGVTVDELVKYKNKRAVIPFEDRLEIVRSIKYVDAAIPQENIDKFAAWEKLKFDILFVGDDWYQSERWQEMEKKFHEVGVKVIYFPYTKGISSTVISRALTGLRNDAFNQNLSEYKKSFCMSSFLMYRYLYDEKINFGLPRKNVDISAERTPIADGDELIDFLRAQVEAATRDGKAALALSGGIDSAILAKFMPEGSTAYTFRCLVPGKKVVDESERAARYAEICKLNHKVIDIYWEDVEAVVDKLMLRKGAPIHSIETQIFIAAQKVLADGFTKFIFGENADIIYGGMDGLLSKDWTFGEFVNRYSYILPYKVLKSPRLPLEPFREFEIDGHIDGHEFLNKYFRQEALGSYTNACEAAGVEFVAPYSLTKLAKPIDYKKIRGGESKYIVREAFRKLYPDENIPTKTPMPRPVNEWFENWQGPKRAEFLPHCHETLNGNQRWMLWCLERFLNLFEGV